MNLRFSPYLLGKYSIFLPTFLPTFPLQNLHKILLHIDIDRAVAGEGAAAFDMAGEVWTFLSAQSLQIIEPLLMTYIRFLNLWNGINNGIDK